MASTRVTRSTFREQSASHHTIQVELAIDSGYNELVDDELVSNEENMSTALNSLTSEDIIRMKRAEARGRQGVKHEAFNELLNIRASNGGRSTYGDIPLVVKKYNKLGYHFVTIGVLKYMIYSHRYQHNLIPGSINVDAESYTSPLTFDESLSGITNGTCTCTIVDEAFCEDHSRLNEQINPAASINVGGRAIGTTKAARKIAMKKKLEATTKAATMFADERNRAHLQNRQVAGGTLARIIHQVEEDFDLEHGIIRFKTVFNRVQRNNLTGTSPQKISPLSGIEPLLAEYCIKLAQMGSPLCREQVISLAISLIMDTPHLEKVVELKKRLKLLPRETVTPIDYSTILKSRWYNGFMRRYEENIRRGKGRVRDIKRHTWCKYEHFEEMYDCIYNCMVEAGICKLNADARYYNLNGVVVTDPANSFGRPTKYELTNPEMLVFVDETGCNTNQQTDGQIGGQNFVLPVDYKAGLLSATTDIHFTVLCFNLGTGQPIMCAVILKSDQEVCKIPLSWKYGIDITKDLRIEESETDAELFHNNSGCGKAMQGGPTCFFFKERKYHALSVHLQRLVSRVLCSQICCNFWIVIRFLKDLAARNHF
jgi:hypothetical protein